ncbi:MAG: leucyl aminopeptidase family protein, partial [Rhodospirillaceae bacterium]|nr:leucyl aminopeptidase family protein [Rhodospirillaceae bacterium]
MTVQGLIEAVDDAVPLITLTTAGYAAWIVSQPARVATWLRRTGFEAEAGHWQVVPEVDGDIAMVVAGLGDTPDLWSAASLPSELPDDLCLALDPDGEGAADAVAEGWAAGCHRFTRYRKTKRGHASLVWPQNCDRSGVTARAEAVCLGRDLVNTPAEDMGPADLEDAAEAIAQRAGATLSVIQGEKLLSEGYPAVHAVGRASARPPRLLDLHWGRDDAPRVTLVGKGVCFD